MTAEYYNIVNEAEAYLKYLKTMGVVNVPKGKKEKNIKVKGPEADALPAEKPISKKDKVISGSLNDVSADIGDCKRCKLHSTRTNIVFGVGDPKAKLMFVGEGPGFDEDQKGEPFVGRAGQLLTKMIAGMGLTRDDVYIANVVKCRPPNNRNPEPDEIAACSKFLTAQIAAIGPKVIVCLGTFASQTLLRSEERISDLRGKFHDWQGGVKLIPTFHPAFLLRNPAMKKPVWEDMKLVMKELGMKVPS